MDESLQVVGTPNREFSGVLLEAGVAETAIEGEGGAGEGGRDGGSAELEEVEGLRVCLAQTG